MRFLRHGSPESFQKRETGIKPASFIELENSVETGLSLAKLHACIALLCLVQQYKIIKKPEIINKKRLPVHPPLK
jgi:hypothetical protein